jgi:hypothetical protein
VGGTYVNMNHTMYIFPERVKFSFPFSFTWRGKNDRNFLSRVGSIRIKQREKANNKNGQNPDLGYVVSQALVLHTGLYRKGFTMGGLV